jgi:hypothetical protein
VADGPVLSAVNAAATFVALTAIDYTWDLYWPNTNASGVTFGTWASMSRLSTK